MMPQARAYGQPLDARRPDVGQPRFSGPRSTAPERTGGVARSRFPNSRSRTTIAAMTREARRGVRVYRPTRPAAQSLVVCPDNRCCPARDDDLDLAARSERVNRSRILTDRKYPPLPGAGGAKTVVGVPVRRRVPVTVRRADVRRLIVERPAPKKTRVWSPPGEKTYPGTGRTATGRYSLGVPVQSNGLLGRG
jgi:hypothetical protein